jgi:membrane protease YdiL (CAAX protease family)
MNMKEEQNWQEQPLHPEHSLNEINHEPHISYFGQFGILLGFAGAGLVIGSLLFILIWTMMTGNSPLQIEKDMLKLQYANAAKVSQLISSIFMFFAPAFFYALIVNKKPLKQLGFRSLATRKQVLLVIAITIIGLLLSGALSEINQLIPISKKMAASFQKLEDNYSEQVMAMANMRNLRDYFFTMIVIALTPAIVEETLFRGGFQQVFEKWFRNPWAAIIVTSILFSAIHVSYYGFLPRAALGVMLGLLFYYSRNIWLNILMHFLNNGIAVTQLYILTRSGKISKDSLDDNFHLGYISFIVTIFAIAILYGLFMSFKKESKIIGADKIDNMYSPSDNPFS